MNLIKDYEQLSEMQMTQIQFVKEQTNALWNQMNDSLVALSPRELALAKTNLEQAAMWYTKSIITENQKG